jgi:benzoate membrane transport protein
MVAGALVLLLGLFGLTERLAVWLPPPIVFGLLAGAVLPFFLRLFVALGHDPVPVGIILASYLLAAFTLGARIPPMLPALIVGFVVAAVVGDLSLVPEGAFPFPAMTGPVFSIHALLSATPIMVVLITLQANVPSIVFLRRQGYEPPERVVTGVSGIGTLVGSFLGPTGVSLSLPATAIVGGEDAGDLEVRHRAVYVVGAATLLIGLLGWFAGEFAASAPQVLLDAVVGLAVIGVLVNALREATRGPLVIGPMFAFAVSQSGLSLLGLGPYFWALTLGLVSSLLVERAGWRELRRSGGNTATSRNREAQDR